MDVPSLVALNRPDQLLPSYIQSVALLQADDFTEINAQLLLLKRDLLEAHAGALDAAQAAALQAADRQLRAKAALVAQALPVPVAHPRGHWWWFLHEAQQ